jgi:hypothetical protein
MMHKSQQHSHCQHTGIANSSIGDVSVCTDCNIVLLTLSHMTLRFTPEAFRCLAQLLNLSQGRLDQACQAAEGAGAQTPPSVIHPPLH